jgi:hypothetical protein
MWLLFVSNSHFPKEVNAELLFGFERPSPMLAEFVASTWIQV